MSWSSAAAAAAAHNRRQRAEPKDPATDWSGVDEQLEQDQRHAQEFARRVPAIKAVVDGWWHSPNFVQLFGTKHTDVCSFGPVNLVITPGVDFGEKVSAKYLFKATIDHPGSIPDPVCLLEIKPISRAGSANGQVGASAYALSLGTPEETPEALERGMRVLMAEFSALYGQSDAPDRDILKALTEFIAEDSFEQSPSLPHP